MKTLSQFSSGRLLLMLSIVTLYSCDYKPRNQGRALYNEYCQSCHMEQGQGLGALMPPVANSDYVMLRSDELACVIRNGISGPMEVNGTKYEGAMLGYAQLTEVEISNLVYYLMKELNQMDTGYNIIQVREQLNNCAY